MFSKVVPMPSNRYAPPTRGGGPIGIRTLTRPVMSRMLYQLSCRSIYALPEFRRCPVGSCFLRAAAYIGGHMPRGHPGYDPAGNPKPCPCRAVAHIALPELHRCQKEPLLTGYGLYMPRERAIIRPLEAHTGFEPARSAWKAETLPLHQCAMLVRPGFPGDGLSRTGRLGKKRERGVMGYGKPWRAERDSYPLPPAVPAGMLPKALPARIAATDVGKKSNHLGFLLFSGSLT